MALQDFSGAMVIVSHDRHLLRVTCDQLMLVHDARVDDFPLSLDDYLKWLSEQNRQAVADSTDTDKTGDVNNNAVTRKDRKRLQAEQRKRLQPLHKRVTQAEAKLEKLHNIQAASTALYSPPPIRVFDSQINQ